MKHFCYGEIEKDIDIKMIDDIFNLIISNSTAIPEEFYHYLEKLDLLYTNKIIHDININITMLKDIIYTLYDIYNSRFKNLLLIFRRSTLINLYNICKDAENKTKIDNFIAYYRKSLINQYTENIT